MISENVVSATEIIRLFELLKQNNIKFWLLGGWGIDALLETQTRDHKDIDVLIQEDDTLRLIELLKLDGYTEFHLWEENHWDYDSKQQKIPTAFYIFDSKEREFDVHIIHLDHKGNALPLWELGELAEEKFQYTALDISAIGKINGVSVPCLSPEKQMQAHSGYELPESHQADIRKIHEKFGIAYPS